MTALSIGAVYVALCLAYVAGQMLIGHHRARPELKPWGVFLGFVFDGGLTGPRRTEWWIKSAWIIFLRPVVFVLSVIAALAEVVLEVVREPWETRLWPHCLFPPDAPSNNVRTMSHYDEVSP